MKEQTPQDEERIRGLIEECGTPLYVYDLDIVRKNFERLNAAITYPNKRIFYAMMANNHPEILKVIKEMGGGVQVNSLHEIDLARKSDFYSWGISFTSTGLDKKSLDRLRYEGVQVNLDSVEEVNKFCNTPSLSYFGTRLQMPQVYFNGRFSKSDTGIREEDLELVLINARNQGKRIKGIHGYCGSNIFDTNFLKRSADYIIKCAEQFSDLSYINFGGGFGIPVNRHLKPIDLEDVLSHYCESIAGLSEKLGRLVELRIEPGRALVANAGTLYTRATNVKRLHRGAVKGKDQVAVDCGFGEFARPRLYGVFHEIFALGKEGNTRYCDVRGNTVLQDDYLTIDSSLPEIKEGDILGIRNVGAYGKVMASGFPGKELPREVCI